MKNLIVAILSLFTIQANAQMDKAKVDGAVKSKSFTFVATTALPMNSTEINAVLSRMPGATNGASINLSGANYDLQLKKDSLVAYLPYYGRSFNAPIGRDDSGFKFTSTQFTVESTPRKKGGWQVNIISKDTRESVRMSLSISPNGNASLTVNSNNKQSISYNGYLVENGKNN